MVMLSTRILVPVKVMKLKIPACGVPSKTVDVILAPLIVIPDCVEEIIKSLSE